MAVNRERWSKGILLTMWTTGPWNSRLPRAHSLLQNQMAHNPVMADRDAEHRITQLETQMEERTRTAAEFRGEIRVLLDTISSQQLAVRKELGRLTAAFEAHLAEDRRILQRVNGGHQQERLVHIGLGVGSGGGIATIIVTIGHQLGWW